MGHNAEEWEVTSDQVDDASANSFPASDPPSYSSPTDTVGATPADDEEERSEEAPEEGDDKPS